MTIDKSNIEAYLLDYLEGNLDPLLTAELMAFMAENPGYEKWLPEYDGHLCLSDGASFENKALLKKDFGNIPVITAENFDEFCIAETEGILDPADSDRLEEYLSHNPEKRKVHALFYTLKLQPDLSLLFPGKAEIRKPVKHRMALRIVYYSLAAAAAVAFLVMLTSRKPSMQNYPGSFTVNSPVVTLTPQMPKIAEITAVPASGRVPKARRPLSAVKKEIVNPESGDKSIRENSFPLAAIEPIRDSRLFSDQPVPEMQYKISVPKQEIADNRNLYAAQDEDPDVLKRLGNVVKKLNLWKAAESAVTGFNYLTESRISLSKTTDQNGKLTGLGFETEQYTISGNKIK